MRRLRIGEEKRKKERTKEKKEKKERKERKKEETTGRKYIGMPYSIGRP